MSLGDRIQLWLLTCMRSDSGPLEDSMSLKRHSCRKSHLAKSMIKLSPGGNVSYCRDVFFLCLAGSVEKPILAASKEGRGEKCGICIKKKCVRGASN